MTAPTAALIDPARCRTSALARQPSPVDDDVRAGHVSGLVTREEHRSIRDVLRPSEPRPGGPASRVLDLGIDQAVDPGFDDLARGDAVANDELMRIVGGDLAGEVDRAR